MTKYQDILLSECAPIIAHSTPETIAQNQIRFRTDSVLLGNSPENVSIENAVFSDRERLFNLLFIGQTSGHIRPRSREYVEIHWNRFKVARVNGVIVGCVEIIPLDTSTIELGGIVIDPNFMNFHIGKRLIETVEIYALQEKKDVVAVTANPKLTSILEKKDYVLTGDLFPERIALSP